MKKDPRTLAMLAARQLMPSFATSLYYLAKYGAKISTSAEVDVTPNLKMGRDCTVSSFVKIKAYDGPIELGERCGFATGCFISAGPGGIHFGDHVMCGPNVTILARHYNHGELDVPFEDQGSSSKGVRIGRNVWIGAGSVITDGAEIGDNTIVAANSLVNRRYRPNVILQGSPAKVVMKRGEQVKGDS